MMAHKLIAIKLHLTEDPQIKVTLGNSFTHANIAGKHTER